MAARLNHPHVCTIHEVGEAEGQVYVAMELVPGEALSERLASGRMGVEEVLRLGQQMADALAHAHENGVVHRDFKSANVIVTPEGRAKVLDFGLAKPLAETESEATTLTAAPLTARGAVVGHPGLHGAGAAARAGPRTRAATSGRWAWCSTRWRAGRGRSRGRPGTSSPRRSSTIRPSRCRRTCRRPWPRSSSAVWRRIPRSGTRGRERCARRWRRCGRERVAGGGVAPRLRRASPRGRCWRAWPRSPSVVAIAAVLDVGGVRGRPLGRAGGPGRRSGWRCCRLRTSPATPSRST